MMATTVKEEIQTQIDLLRQKAIELEAQLASLPEEVHAMAPEIWAKIRAFFGQAPKA